MTIVFLFLSLLTLIFIGTLERPSLTGFITSVGGNVTNVNIVGAPIDHWRGIYGNLGTGPLDSIDLSVSDPEVVNLDLSLVQCYHTEVYATLAENILWAAVVPGLPSEVDSYIGLNSSHPLSATNAFTSVKPFNVSGQTLALYSASTNSYNGDYDIGILKQSSLLIFVTRPIENGLSFDNTPSDYQIMLPLPISGAETYYFFIDPWDNSLCGPPILPNNPPVSTLNNIDGYIDTPIYNVFYVTDQDDDRIALNMQPDLDFINLQFVYDLSDGRYIGIIDYIPRVKGEYYTNFILNDGKGTITERIDFDIGYCGNLDRGGDPKCENRFEDCETCPQDCGSCKDNRDSMVLLTEEDICVNKNLKIVSYERYKENKCNDVNNVNGVEVCDPVSNVNIGLFVLEKFNASPEQLLINQQEERIYREAGIADDIEIIRGDTIKTENKWLLVDNYVTDSSGGITLMINDSKEYKLVGEKSGYYATYLYLDPIECPEIEEEKTEIPKITGKTVDNETTAPEIEKPDDIYTAWEPTIPQLILIYVSLFSIGIFVVRYFRKKR